MRNKYLWLQLFGGTPWTDPGTSSIHPLNRTSDPALAVTMKTFYSDYMLENKRENEIFGQFARKEKIHGNQVEWRKFETLKKPLTPLEEGVIPNGEKIAMTSKTADTLQYGMYVPITDRLEAEAYDDVMMLTVKELSATMVATFDTLTRNIISAGTNVMYAPTVNGGIETAVEHRYDLDKTSKLTSTLVNKVATALKKTKTPKINGDYVGIIHPSQAFDLRESKGWLDAHIYSDVTPLYNGEIGKLHGVRFIEATEVRVFRGKALTEDAANLTVKTAVTASTTVAVVEAITTADAAALAGRTIVDIDNNEYEIASATAGAAGLASLTLSAAATIAKDKVLYPAGGGKGNVAVYGSLFFGENAYGEVDPEGEGSEMIIKTKQQIGGALEQFGTAGFKFNHGAVILYPERVIRVETSSELADLDEAN